MKRTLTAAAVAALATIVSLPAAASVISMQTRFSTAGAAPAGSVEQMGAYYKDLVEGHLVQAPTTGYCDTAPAAYAGLENSNACGGGDSDIAFKFEVEFGISSAQAGSMRIQIGPDFGKGGAVFLDGVLLGATRDDLWWDGNYAADAEVLSFGNLQIGGGNHTLTVYGLEGCCDGQNSARYRLGDDEWTTFSVRDGLQAVPEPASVALVLAGLFATALTRSRSRR